MRGIDWVTRSGGGRGSLLYLKPKCEGTVLFDSVLTFGSTEASAELLREIDWRVRHIDDTIRSKVNEADGNLFVLV